MRPDSRGWPILGLCWPICWAMFAHLGGYDGAMLPRLGAMLDHVAGEVGPSGTRRGDLGLCCVHEFTFIPQICLKKLSPVACEAPIPFLQHHFSEKAESCLGRAHPRWAPEGSRQWPARFQETLPEGRKRGSEAPGGFPVAEATIQATTSLPLHGMAGFKGYRPDAADPFWGAAVSGRAGENFVSHSAQQGLRSGAGSGSLWGDLHCQTLRLKPIKKGGFAALGLIAHLDLAWRCRLHLRLRLGITTGKTATSDPKAFPKRLPPEQGNSMAWRAQWHRFSTCVGVIFSVKRCVQNL